MKPAPRHDFPLRVVPESREVGLHVAELYRGIYEVILNFTVKVFFVPEFTSYVGHWPPTIPQDVDEVRTVQEARLIAMAMSTYCVTPNDLLKGQVQHLALSSPTMDRERLSTLDAEFEDDRVVYYVGRRDFDVFDDELTALVEQCGGLHDPCKVSDIRHYEVVRFLLSRVVASQSFLAADARLLGRESNVSRVGSVQ